VLSDTAMIAEHRCNAGKTTKRQSMYVLGNSERKMHGIRSCTEMISGIFNSRRGMCDGNGTHATLQSDFRTRAAIDFWYAIQLRKLAQAAPLERAELGWGWSSILTLHRSAPAAERAGIAYRAYVYWLPPNPNGFGSSTPILGWRAQGAGSVMVRVGLSAEADVLSSPAGFPLSDRDPSESSGCTES
jgi:hypothetical protein